MQCLDFSIDHLVYSNSCKNTQPFLISISDLFGLLVSCLDKHIGLSLIRLSLIYVYDLA